MSAESAEDCSVCGGQLTVVYRRNVVGRLYWRCRRCNFGRIAPVEGGDLPTDLPANFISPRAWTPV